MASDDPTRQALWTEAIARFDQLLELEPEARDAALEAVTDPEVRALLGQWLRGHAREPGVLDVDLASAVARADEGVGRRLGRWRLDSRIGHGGMATVYRASSIEPPVGQQAAVKVMALGVLARQGSERFMQEQRALSRLSHPGIASLYEAGVAADGTPWFAMALVEGERIDQWCDGHETGIAGRVDLVLQVCAAVAYAHRNLVIHRDIKPSNILVDREGRTVLLDFGIARLSGDMESEQTATVLRMLTPEYAAPEQFGAAPASTAMDVHGLGALLYRLLAGVAPRGGVVPDADTRTLPPSRVRLQGTDSTGRAWSRQLRGDLDTITMKALQHDPEARYASADALAEDLQRWRGTRPILAHPPSLRYRTARYLQRHRWGVAAGLAIALAAGAAVAGIAWQGQQARRQAERAELTRDFLREVFAEANPLHRGGRGADIGGVLGQAAAQAPVRFADRPDLQAETLQLVGELQRLNGDNLGAAQSLSRAWELDPGKERDWSDDRRQAVLALADSLAAVGRRDQARTLLSDWLATDSGTRARAALLQCRGHGELSRLEDDLSLARERLERVHAACLALPAGTPERTGMAATLSSARRLDGEHASALALVEREEAALAALPSLTAEAWLARLRLATERAKGLEFLRRPDEAERATGAIIEQAEAVLGPDNVFLASPLQVQAGSLNRMGRADEAAPLLRRALALIERDGQVQNRPLYASLLLDLGVNAHLRGHPAEAEANWRQAVDAYAQAGQHAALGLGTALSNLTHSTMARGAYAEAAGFGRSAVSFLEANAPNRPDKIALAEFNLCMALAHQGQAEAIDHCQRGAQLDLEYTPDDIVLVGEGQQYLADAHCLLGQWQPALDAADRAIALLQPLGGDPDSDPGQILLLARHHRAEALAGLGRRAQARAELAGLAHDEQSPAMVRARQAARAPRRG